MSEAMSAVILLDEARIRRDLSPVAQSALTALHIFPTLPSTNAWLLERGACGAACLAEEQTAGRGRRGRNWRSPAQQNVYLSLRWCYPEVPQHYGSLGLLVGLAVARTLDKLGISGHGLKWPNDIYYQQQKIGGILLQTATPLQQVVVGIGLNVNMQPDSGGDIDQPWSSLRTILGRPVDRNAVSALLLNELVSALAGFTDLSREEFVQEWHSRDILTARAVTVHLADEELSGTAHGIDAEGGLRVALQDGATQVFSAADVSVRL